MHLLLVLVQYSWANIMKIFEITCKHGILLGLHGSCMHIFKLMEMRRDSFSAEFPILFVILHTNLWIYQEDNVKLS